MLNQLILAKDSPSATSSRDRQHLRRAGGVRGESSPYAAPDLLASAAALKADDSDTPTRSTTAMFCVNADKGWFAKKGIAIPKTLDDLTKADYQDLLVVENPASSSPGWPSSRRRWGQG